MTHQPSKILRATLAALAGGLSLLLNPFAIAEEVTKPFDIPAGAALPALKRFVAQSGEQLLYSADAVQGVTTNPVKGEFTPRRALDQMVDGTALRVVADRQNGALSLVRASRPNAPRAAQTGSDRPSNQDRIEEGVMKMGQFEVFGSKLINLDVPRTRDDAQPYVVFDRNQIGNTQATNLTDFFRTRLPMANATGMATFTAGMELGNRINLRGLGTNQTLILVDGRRLPGFTLGGVAPGKMPPDINGIPLAMIERIEILPSTASGIYGGDATGGVINIITRKDFSGTVLTANYVNTFDSDSGQYRFDLASTMSLRGGATLITLTASYARGNVMLTEDRSFAQRARDLAFANNPALLTGTSTPPSGYTTNIRSQNGTNLVLKPQYGGTALNSPRTFVPVGYAGITSDNAAALVANAARYNLALPNDTGGRRSTLVTNTPSQSLSLSLRQEITPWLEGYADLSQNVNDSVFAVFSPASTSTLAATAPNNPFTTAVNVAFPAVGIEGDSYLGLSTTRVTGGLVAKLPGNWTAGLDYTWGRTATLLHSANPLLGDPDGTGPGLSYATALSTGALDVMRDLNARSLDYSPYLMPIHVTDNRGSSITRTATARASGPVFRLPAGEVVVSASAEWQEDVVEDNIITNASLTAPGYTYRWFPEFSGNNRSAYLEARVPLLTPLAGNPRQARLELQLAARHDAAQARTWQSASFPPAVPSPTGPFPDFPYRTRDFQDTSWTAGLRYEPIESLTLRASAGTGFLAPSLNQLSDSIVSSNRSLTVVDPKRGGISQTYTPVDLIASGGNPGLRPEHSENASAGISFTPRFLPGLRISVDYTKITKTDEIAVLPVDQLFAFEDLFPGEIVRAPLTAADQALGYTGGVVVSYTLRANNIARRVVEAVDIQVDYTRKTSFGEFHAYAIATTNRAFEQQATPTAANLDAVGFSDGPMRWRANGGLDWQRGPWSAGWNAQYYTPIRLYASNATTATVASTVLTQGSDRYPAQVFHEARLSYQFGHGGQGWRRLFSDLRIRIGLQNVFNREPALRAGTGTRVGYQSLEDPRGRRYSLNVQKQF